MTDAVASAPASSANLGPGFDTISLALDLHCQVRARRADEWSINHLGPERFVGDSSDDAILDAAQGVSDTPLAIEVENSIPLSRGLGSSAAAFAAGGLAAMRASGRDPDHDELFEFVRDREGHPDNAAAAVYGGLAAVANGEVIHLTLSRDLIPVVAVPSVELKTRDSRRALRPAYEIGVMARTLGRYTALLEGLRTGSQELLTLARGDELHEVPRSGLNPVVPRLMEIARVAGALHSCWSGSGPSVLSFTTDESHANVVAALESDLGKDGRVLVLAPDVLGAR